MGAAVCGAGPRGAVRPDVVLAGAAEGARHQRGRRGPADGGRQLQPPEGAGLPGEGMCPCVCVFVRVCVHLCMFVSFLSVCVGHGCLYWVTLCWFLYVCVSVQRGLVSSVSCVSLCLC